ncbi:MAG: metallophosphoesterase [Fimbriimonadales bacterium]|nr:metallophosphoesterase [Fimbriimonadales bacterium]
MVILHTNDLHGKFGERQAMLVAEMKKSADFYFDSGDCVKSGNVGIPIGADPVWNWLHLAGCDASVPGNREFHVTTAGFRAKIAGAKHPILCANLVWNGRVRKPLQGDQETPLPESVTFGNVGVFGLMVPMVTERMAAKRLSAFLNLSPIETAKRVVDELRSKCDKIILLSHLGFSNDLALVEKVSGIDIVLGGHSHDRIETPEKVRDTWICQAGSHGKEIGRLELGNSGLKSRLLPLQ